MNDIKIISLGGSIIAPEKVDIEFLKAFFDLVATYLDRGESRKIILVCGGGSPAREYQRAYKAIVTSGEHDAADRIGIAATRLNAALMKEIFSVYCLNDVVTDPTSVVRFDGKILVAAGWKPGFSTDYDAVILAERFSADQVINLSNLAKIYTDDPKKNPAATPLDTVGWEDFRHIVGEGWEPGKNAPFDPIAAKRAAACGMRVIFANGRDLDNVKHILNGKPFEGTVIGPG
ncbi:MAG: UMP kinase [Spirochaetales bacterium]|nr:UMP kinase [Spirochaetales bacterium]